MSRNIDITLLAALVSGEIVPCVLAQFTFKSQTVYCWTGVGPLTWNGNTFLGLGKLGEIADVTESSEIRADGTSVTLNGIDPMMLSEALTDIRLGAPANLWFGCFVPGSQVLIGTPYLFFSGQVDKASIHPGVETCSITLALENRMLNHQRASNRRYTTNDQHAMGFPDDTGFNYVEQLNDRADLWG